jgi:glycosyltransferase involved in cell wall biosynthesis
MNDVSTMNKVMEYMALGKPVVQFDLTEGRASAGDASLYARPNDPADFADRIAELARDPGRREAMGRIGLARVRDGLGWEHSAPRLLAAYDRIYAGLPRPEPELQGLAASQPAAQPPR